MANKHHKAPASKPAVKASGAAPPAAQAPAKAAKKEAEKKENNAPEVELPPHACAYCGYHADVKCVAKCIDCDKWFCNSMNGMTVSHIVAHMAHAKHRKMSMHPESDIGGDPLECYVCDGQNVFTLGIVTSPDGESVLCCREPCLHGPEIVSIGVSSENWTSVLENRRVIDTLCQVPPQRSNYGADTIRVITNKTVSMIEDGWKRCPTYTAEQAIDVAQSEMFHQGGKYRFAFVPKTFRDGEQMHDLYKPLVEDEMRQSRDLDESFMLTGIQVEWSMALGRPVAVFQTQTEEHSLNVGRLVRLCNEATGAEFETVLISDRQSDSKLTETVYRCELSNSHKGSTRPADGKYSVSLIFNGVAFERALEALRSIRNYSRKETGDIGKSIYDILLGRRVINKSIPGRIPDNLNAPGVAALNDIQRNAVKEVLLKPLSLIQGPPGTGKTTTTATIVYHLSRMHGKQILVCAPSNIACDELASRIHRTGIKVLRIVARSREDATVTSGVEELTLHHRIEERTKQSKEFEKYRELVAKRKEFGTLSNNDYEAYMVAQKKVEEAIIRDADVICCTCVVAADKRLSKFLFRHVVIDEATQSQEPETLIPLTLGCEQVILIGDHCQMGPVVMSREAGEAGLSRTVFERLVFTGHKPYRLEVQYRMHPELSKFSSNMFYDGTLQNGVTAQSRDSTKSFPWPDPSKPFFFYHSDKPEEIGASGISVLNRTEAHVAERMVTQLLKSKVRPSDIGIITPYEAQRNYLITHLTRSGQFGTQYHEVEVASVDSFQGREKDFIILSCVRSNDSHAIGFLKDWRRLNVALTRARKGVMVIGNARILAEDPTWNAFLHHCQSRNLIVYGSIMNLESFDMTIPEPIRRNRNNGISDETRALVRGDVGYEEAEPIYD